jgi:histone H3
MSRTQSRKQPRKVLRDNIQGFTKNDVNHLARKAGIKSLSGLMVEEMRGILLVFLKVLLDKAIMVTVHERKQTLEPEHVHLALKYVHNAKEYVAAGSDPKFDIYNRCKSLTITSDKPRKRRAKPGTKSLRDIRKAQKSDGCLVIRKIPFQRMVREVAQDYMDDLKFRAGVVELIQLIAESYMIELLKGANLSSIHANRQTVMPKDLTLAMKIKDHSRTIQ